MHPTVTSVGVRAMIWGDFILHYEFCGVWNQNQKVFFQKPSIVPLCCYGKVSCSRNGPCLPVSFLSTSFLAGKWNYFYSVVPCFLCPWDSHMYILSVWNTHRPHPFSPLNSQSPFRSQLTHPFSWKVLPHPPRPSPGYRLLPCPPMVSILHF